MPVRAALAMVLACSLSLAPQAARAEVATAGEFVADFDGSLPLLTFDGAATFDPANADFVVAGMPIDLQGEFPAGAAIENGMLTISSFSFDLTATSTSGAFLEVNDITGTPELCQSAGCPPGSATFVGVPQAPIVVSPGILPAVPRLYVVDGTVPLNFSGGDDVMGVFAINAFPIFETSAGGAILHDTGEDIFYDSVREAIITFLASVEFAEVTVAGTTTIVPVSAATGGLPPDVELNLDGLESVFVDIRTIAEFTPPVTVCLGINPGGTPPSVPLEDLRLLHRASVGGSFVVTDAQVMTNPDRLCADVDTLSPFVIGVDVTPPTTTTSTSTSTSSSTSTSTSSSSSSSSSTSSSSTSSSTSSTTSTIVSTTSSSTSSSTTNTTATSATSSSGTSTSTSTTSSSSSTSTSSSSTSSSTSTTSTSHTATSSSTTSSSTSTTSTSHTATSSSSTSTSTSSSTSTSTSSSTSTTVPSGCTSEPTFESILCRIDALIALTVATDMSERVRDNLLRRLEKARAVVIDARDRLDMGHTRGAKSRLKSAERRLRGYGYRVRSLAGRRNIVDPADAERLSGDAQGIEDDVKTLRKSL